MLTLVASPHPATAADTVSDSKCYGLQVTVIGNNGTTTQLITGYTNLDEAAEAKKILRNYSADDSVEARDKKIYQATPAYLEDQKREKAREESRKALNAKGIYPVEMTTSTGILTPTTLVKVFPSPCK
jgi:hypothetical protein